MELNNISNEPTHESDERAAVDPWSIVLTDAKSAKNLEAFHDSTGNESGPPGANEGGEGGEGGEEGIAAPPSPPLETPSVEQMQQNGAVLAEVDEVEPEHESARVVSNAQFVAEVFQDVAESSSLAICSKPGDPDEGGWFAQAADDIEEQCPAYRNNYVSCASFKLAADGKIAAKQSEFSDYRVLMLDDIDGKTPRERLKGLPPPSFEIETSPGNFQVGYILDTPLTELAEVEVLQSGMKAAGLGDSGSFGANRWMRLPNAINGKSKHASTDGSPYQCQLKTYNPENRYAPSELMPQGMPLMGSLRLIKEQRKPAIARMALEGISHEVFRPAATEHPVVTALKAKGWYKQDLGRGKHDITCPRVQEHTGGLDTGTAYFEPSGATPTGGFKCQHSHGDTMSVGNLLEQLDVDDQAARNKPEIRFVQGALDQVVKASDYVLSKTGNVFQAGGVIVILRRAGNDYRSEPANIAELTMSLAAHCSFEIFDRREKAWRRSDPPERVVRTLMGAASYTFLPPLNGIARQPYYRPGDGTLVTSSGYDVKSGFYGAFEEGQVKLGKPTREAADVALSKLRSLLSEFVFESPADEAAALSAVFTAAVRPYLPVAPAYLTTAPESGSGKSYLNAIVTQFAGGEPARASFPLTADEATKSVLAHLMSSPSCIEYDDMVCNFRPHAILNRVLTCPSITDRVLGVSKTAKVSTRTLFIGSGINVVPERDMNRRVISIRLASVPTNRIGRVFRGKPAELVHDCRMEFVSEVLTIIEAWKDAGCPKSDVLPIASYGHEWADHCRHPLIWLGLPDPAQSLFTQVEEDSDSEPLIELLNAWYRAFGASAVTVRKVVNKAIDHPDGTLFEALEDIQVCDGKNVNRSRLGRYLAKNAKSIVGGMRLLEGRSDGRRGWRVEKVAKGEPETPPSPPSSEPSDHTD